MAFFNSTFHSMSLLYLYFTFAVADDSDNSGGIQVNSMDLLSGVPAMIVILVGIIQIWPTPAQLYRRTMQSYLDWLKRSIEKDFFITLNSCEKKCQTHVFEPTAQLFEKRILSDIGDINEFGCSKSGDIAVDKLIDFIRVDSNSVTLEELALVSRYPEIQGLRRALKVFRNSPTIGRRVVFYQWFVVGLVYSFNWIFLGGLPDSILHLFHVIWNVVRRVFGRLPIDSRAAPNLLFDYHLAELAEHRLISEHLPWTRYAIYYLLASLTGSQPSIRRRDIADNRTGIKRANDIWPDNVVFDNPFYFNHPMFGQLQMAKLMTTDECSAAILLYSLSLHSLRVLMLCRNIGFSPPHIILGSIHSVKSRLVYYNIVIKHSHLDTVFASLYAYPRHSNYSYDGNLKIEDYINAQYSKLQNKLQSPMGSQITDCVSMQFLANIALRPINEHYLDWARGQAKWPNEQDYISIQGISISKELLQKLCKGHIKAAARLQNLLECFAVPRIYWGVSVWLFYSLFSMFRGMFPTVLSPIYSLIPCNVQRKGNYIRIKELLFMLMNSPFAIHYYPQIIQDNQSKDWDKSTDVIKRGQLLSKVKDSLAFDDTARRTSAPAWCTCADHCRGTCTLIVSELGMHLSPANYFSAPCSFVIHVFKNKPMRKDLAISPTIAPKLADITKQSALSCNVTPTKNKVLSEPPILMLQEPRKPHASPNTFPRIDKTHVEFFRLVCMCNRHLLFQLAGSGSVVTHIVESKRDRSSSPSQSIALSGKLSSQRNPRIITTDYLLSDLLYENSLQIVAIFDNKLYTIQLPDEQIDSNDLLQQPRVFRHANEWLFDYDSLIIDGEAQCLS